MYICPCNCPRTRMHGVKNRAMQCNAMQKIANHFDSRLRFPVYPKCCTDALHKVPGNPDFICASRIAQFGCGQCGGVGRAKPPGSNQW